MSSLRMVKLFGWEGKMSRRVSDVREEELQYLKKRRLLLMLSNLVKSVLVSLFRMLRGLKSVYSYVVPLVAITGCFVTL